MLRSGFVLRTVGAVMLSALGVLALLYVLRAALLYWFADTGRL